MNLTNPAFREYLRHYVGSCPERVTSEYDVAKYTRLWGLFTAGQLPGDETMKGRPMPPPRNKKGKPFSWSYTALQQFDTCPRQYAEQRYFCRTPSEETDATRWGNRVHKALELRLGGGTPLPEDLARFEKWPRVLEQVDAARYVELEIALTRELRPVEWFSTDAWARGKVDVLLLAPPAGWVYDWKTGKVKEDRTQFEVFAAFASLLHPDVERWKGGLVWLAHDQVTRYEVEAREIPAIWEGIKARAARVEEAWRTEEFDCNPSGLCRGWCPVKTCEHWRAKR